MENDQVAASKVLERVVTNHTADDVTFYELKSALHERSFGLLIVIFILPVAVPIPLITGLLIIPVWIFSTQMILGMDSPWLPKWLGNKSIKRSTLAKLVEKASPILKKIERLLCQRLSFVSSPVGERIIGIFSFLMCVSIAFPLPFSNLLPAWGILIMALGLLSKDGIMIIAGMVVGSFGLMIATTILVFGATVVLKIFPWIEPFGSF